MKKSVTTLNVQFRVTDDVVDPDVHLHILNLSAQMFSSLVGGASWL